MLTEPMGKFKQDLQESFEYFESASFEFYKFYIINSKNVIYINIIILFHLVSMFDYL